MAVEPNDWMASAEQIAAEIQANTARHDDDDSFVDEAYALLRSHRFFTALVPRTLGGGGASLSEMCAVVRRLGAACGSTALAFSMHSHLVAVAAWRWEKQNAPTEGLLRRVVDEGLVLVSSGGSDWLHSAGSAVKVDGGYRVTARKAFSSGSPAGHLLVTSAVHEDPGQGAEVLHFAVPLGADGVSIASNWKALGMRGTGSHDIILNDVFVPDAAIAGRRPQGEWHMLFHIISKIAFALIYSAYLGVAEGARAQAIQLVKDRPESEHLALAIGEMENAFMTAELAHAEMIRVAECDPPGPVTTSRAMAARTLLARGAIETVERAMQAAGGAAFLRKTGLERAFRDVQAARFHPLQEKPQLGFTGRVALGWDLNA